MKTLIPFRSGLYLLALLMLFVGLGCKKTAPVLKPTVKILDPGNASLKAKIGDTTFVWQSNHYFGKYGYKSEIGATYDNFGIGDQRIKSVHCRLYSTKDQTTGFTIKSPYFHTNSDALITVLLSPGKKEIGEGESAFVITLTTRGKTYTSEGDQPGARLTVEKSEVMLDYGRYIVVANFKVNCRLYNHEDNTYIDLKDGEMVADFEYGAK